MLDFEARWKLWSETLSKGMPQKLTTDPLRAESLFNIRFKIKVTFKGFEVGFVTNKELLLALLEASSFLFLDSFRPSGNSILLASKKSNFIVAWIFPSIVISCQFSQPYSDRSALILPTWEQKVRKMRPNKRSYLINCI